MYLGANFKLISLSLDRPRCANNFFPIQTEILFLHPNCANLSLSRVDSVPEGHLKDILFDDRSNGYPIL